MSSSVMHLTTPHMRGPHVSALQEALKKRGYYHGAVDGEFGLLTYQAVYRAKYWLGYAKPDHVAGDVLLTFLKATKMPLAYRVRASLRRRSVPKVSRGQLLLREARTHLGTRESPPNSNRVLFSTWYGLIGSWCAMFVTYCSVKVGIKSFQRGVHYAYVPFVVADARAGRNGLTLVHYSNVQPGDYVCYDWNGDGVADHIGIFEKKISSMQFVAIEGNTGDGNNSDGGEVMERSDRYVSEVQAFVRAH